VLFSVLEHHFEAPCPLLHGTLEGVNPVHLCMCDDIAIGIMSSLEVPHLKLVLIR
jgi:hypothetical protein